MSVARVQSDAQVNSVGLFFTISLPTLLLSFKAIKSNRNNNENIKKRKPSALKAIPLFVLFMC